MKIKKPLCADCAYFDECKAQTLEGIRKGELCQYDVDKQV